jgi:hypothetical protein
MLCADGIANSLLEFQSLKPENRVISQSLVESNLDAAQTIVLCAQHQKRIIDDVLTLSKLNSAMLHVTPIQIQVESTVRRTLKMFESELQADDIKMTFVLEPSYHKSQIDCVFCDPVRLTQIFINLLTNVSERCVLTMANDDQLSRLLNLLAPKTNEKLGSVLGHRFRSHQKKQHHIYNGFHQRIQVLTAT